MVGGLRTDRSFNRLRTRIPPRSPQFSGTRNSVLRTPLPPTVLLEETADLPPMFIIAETRLALSFDQTIAFKPEFSVQLPGRLEDGRAVDRAVFGWPTVLASEGEVA
jgi:hypothetical protein